MNCYTHRDSPAIAICKACARGVCAGCATELTYGVACSERCRAEAEATLQMSEKAKRVYGVGGAKRFAPLAPIIWTALGTPFVYLLIAQYLRRGTIEWSALIFLAAVALIGYISWRRAKAFDLNT